MNPADSATGRPTPGSSENEPTSGREPTLGELLMSALAGEQAREHNRRVIDRVAARSSVEAALFQAQVAALNSCDPWANVPAALVLRGYANREFGQDLTPEAVRRIRGRVCEALDIDTAAADALPLGRVAEVLSQRGDPDAPATVDAQARFRWLKVTQVARLFDLNPGQVSKLADDGTFVTNGKRGHDRRIDVLSVVGRELDRLDRQDVADSGAS